MNWIVRLGVCLLFILCLSSKLFSQPEHVFIQTLYPAVPLIEKAYLQKHGVLNTNTKEPRKSFLKRYSQCKWDINCICQLFIGKRPELETVVISQMDTSGFRDLKRFAGLDINAENKAVIDSAWGKTISTTETIIKRFGLGQKGPYHKIDSMSYVPNDRIFLQKVDSSVKSILSKDSNFIFEGKPAILFSIALLQLNGRNEAARFYPNAREENANAMVKIRNTNFSKFAYSALLTPGYGPSDRETPLSSTGKSRCDKVYEEFLKGEAPFIILSGGYVHPYKTGYCEALEMKKYLMEEKKLSDSIIIVEPFARHTTTNIRNASRLAILYYIPSDKPIRVVSSSDQELYISSPLFEQRCKMELKMIPYREMGRDSQQNLIFYPSENAFFFNSNDPLDP